MGRRQVEVERLPGWVVAWFYVTGLVCIWDASFIMLRPHTFPGGKYSWFWHPYKHYINVDKRYKDMEDDFVFCQSLLNYAEVILNFITICLHYTRSRATVALAYTVSVMTFWKTVLYFVMYYLGDPAIRAGNTPEQELFLVIIPNGIWIVLPLFAMAVLWPRLIPAQQPIKSH